MLFISALSILLLQSEVLMSIAAVCRSFKSLQSRLEQPTSSQLKPTKAALPLPIPIATGLPHGHDGACTRLLLCGPEAELPGSLSHSLSRYSHSWGSSTISRSHHAPPLHQPHQKTQKFLAWAWAGGQRSRGARLKVPRKKISRDPSLKDSRSSL